MKCVKMAVLLWAAMSASSWSQASSDLGPFSSREALVRQAQEGNENSRWDLAWLYYAEGRHGLALSAIEGLETSNADRLYLRSWLLAHSGRGREALKLLNESKCGSWECRLLFAGLLADDGNYAGAEKVYSDYFRENKTTDSLVLALTSLALMKDWARFDSLSASVDWKNDPAFGSVRHQIVNLVKMRQVFVAQETGK